MPAPSSDIPADDGRLLANIAYFARALRKAGLPIGPGRVLGALDAVQAVGLQSRQDFYWALHAVFVNRQDQRDLFDQAFHIFWRNPRLLEKAVAMILPQTRLDAGHDRRAVFRRLGEAMGAKGDGKPPEETLEIEAALSFSPGEILQKKDFEKMSLAELAEVKQALGTLRLPLLPVATRRFRPDRQGRRIDMRASLKAMIGTGAIAPKRRDQRTKPPPLVILCDISGSMSRYSRVFLHFMHAVTNDRDRVHTFLFGTRLSNITRALRGRDIDLAVDRVTAMVADWAGGTRIGQCLDTFNRQWSRRVLGQGAIVLFISDGLDRDAGAGLEAAMERLHKSCRRLIWLNPLLRYEAFQPKSLGMRAILPHVDDFRPVHSLDSLKDLTEALARPAGKRLAAAHLWQPPPLPEKRPA